MEIVTNETMNAETSSICHEQDQNGNNNVVDEFDLKLQEMCKRRADLTKVRGESSSGIFWIAKTAL